MKLLLLKAGIPPDARWITVHSHGPDGKGQPVLIQPQPDGSAKVIGGAGGSLSHLRLRGVKSKADYQREAAQKRQTQAEERKAQREKDKAAGLVESKKAAHDRVKQQRLAAEREFIQAVGQAAGWDPAGMQFNADAFPDVSDAALAKLSGEHHRNLLSRARQVVDDQRRRLVADAAARDEAGVAEVPLVGATDDQLTVQDIAPVPDTAAGLGFTPDYAGRAKAAGLTAEEAKAEAEAARQLTPDERAKRIARGQTAKMVSQEAAALREPPAPRAAPDLIDAKKAVDMLKAEKKLRELARQAREAKAKIDKADAKPEPKAFVLEYTADPDIDAKIQQDIDDQLRTASTTAFLSEFHRIAGDRPEETLGKHVGIGAYNSINALALAAGGDALVDRSVVDVLGIAGAAQILARRLQRDLPEQADALADGVREYHTQTHVAAGEAAISQARELMDAAKEIELGEAGNAHELQAAQELNARRRRAVGDAQKIMGQVYGELEANAALVAAMGAKQKGDLQVALGAIGLESAVTRLRAIGLQRGDYRLDQGPGGVFVTVNEAGQDRLAKPVNRADLQQVKRNLAIMRGDKDEDGWMPLGVSRRPDLAAHTPEGVAPRLARPFEPGDDLQASLRDYIGGRAADGDTPADIIADIQSADFFRRAGGGYQQALDAVAPLKDAQGRQQRAEALADTFDGYADDFVRREYGGERSPLNRQRLADDKVSIEALHRALAAHPEGVSAYKQIGELTSQDQRALRERFYRDIAKDTPEAAAARAELDGMAAEEPAKTVEDMFGEQAPNPEHEEWERRRSELQAKVGQGSLDWARYAETMRGHEKAYEAIQDLIRSDVAKSFAEAHNRLRPDAPVKLGRAVIRQNLSHLDATDHEARDERLARERELIDGLRERVQGRYSSGGVADKLDAARDQREAFEQAQMGFFSSDDAPPAAGDAEPAALRGDERHTLGHVAERQIAAMMGTVGKNFKPGQPVQLFQASMSGGDDYARQRAVKLIDANKRVGLHLGAGSGKSLVSMAAFTHAHGQGKAKRAVFAVPSIVQGQFGGEALRFLEPGKFNWHCQPGASREERIAAYKNPDHHMVVVTHQALRDDLLHLGAQHAGIGEREMKDRLAAMSRGERKTWARDAMAHHGINFDFSAVDEGQALLDREGKADSGLSLSIGALTDNTPYHVSMTADPVRNDDASEVFSALQKVAPDRYTDRDAFMRRYGADTLASKDALKREMARYFYAHSILPKVRADRQRVDVKLSAAQQRDMAALDKDVAAMRVARMGGRVDVEAAKRVSPSAFKGVPEAQHEAVAKSLHDAVGVVRDTAVQRVINDHPQSAKADEAIKQVRARAGKPGIVFSRSLASVENLRKRLEGEGLKVVTITGADSSADKDRKREEFNSADILLASDAAAVGLNAQRGRYVLQYDTPQTALTHAQREARSYRVGQRHDVELIDLVADHPSERRARERLASKYGMRNLMSSPLETLDDSGLAYFLQQKLAADA